MKTKLLLSTGAVIRTKKAVTLVANIDDKLALEVCTPKFLLRVAMTDAECETLIEQLQRRGRARTSEDLAKLFCEPWKPEATGVSKNVT